jgi:ribosomal protein L21E
MKDPKADLLIKPISELVTDPDFPTSAIGKVIDIKGQTGVVVGVVKDSIKVRSAEGRTMSYNFHALRRLYGPRVAPTELPADPAPPAPPTPTQPKRDVIAEPNFNSPLVPIESLVNRPGFPGCALGVFVDLHGFAGVVVELVGSSLKVRSREGATHSYNADGLRKIHGSRKP